MRRNYDGQDVATGEGRPALPVRHRISPPPQRQAPEPPESIAGTLAYMAPEQTGRINRPIDSRADLYAPGVTFYRMPMGSLAVSRVGRRQIA